MAIHRAAHSQIFHPIKSALHRRKDINMKMSSKMFQHSKASITCFSLCGENFNLPQLDEDNL